MNKSCATLSVSDVPRGDELREPRTSPSKRSAEALVGPLRDYFRSVGNRQMAGERVSQDDMAAELKVSVNTVVKWLADYRFEARIVYMESKD